MPEPLTFESNIDYVRQMLEAQVDLTADGVDFVPVDSLLRHHRYYIYQAELNADMVSSRPSLSNISAIKARIIVLKSYRTQWPDFRNAMLFLSIKSCQIAQECYISEPAVKMVSSRR